MELALGKHRWSLRLLGIWPNRDSLSDLRFLITITLITSVVVPQLVDLCQNDRETVIENLSSLIPCILVSVKLLIIRINMSKIRECLNAVAQDWNENLKEEEYDQQGQKLRDEFLGIMKRYAKIGSVFNIACTSLLYLTALGFLSLPFTAPDSPSVVNKSIQTTRNFSHSENSATTRRLPLRAIYFFDPLKNSPIFEFTYLSQCIGIVVGATANFSIDSFLAILVLHFCGQLEILGKIIEQYRGLANEHDKSVRIYSGYCSCINCIVERHLRIIRFSTILENSFHPMLLVQLFGNSILFCFLGYQIIMNFEDSEAIGIVTFLVFMFTMMFHLFLYSYVGEELMEKSEAIGYSAYKTTWHDLKPNASKSLIILMARSKTTLRITAGKFFVMSLATYTEILKTSATYLSVLRAVKPVTDG